MRLALQLAYSGLLGAAVLPALARKAARSGLGALHLAERFGVDGLPADQAVWLCAASVGETKAAAGLLAALRARHPQLSCALSYSSEAARAVAREQLSVPAFAQPLDFFAVQRRCFAALRPRLCLLIEQELWPNMLRCAQRAGVPVAVVNARLSAKSARRHARWRSFTGQMFAGLTLVAAQSRADAARFRLLGAKRVAVTGNLKFDAKPDPDKIAAGARLRKKLAAKHDKVLLLASTRPDPNRGPSEEELLLDALAPQLARCAVLLVPRHPERCAQVAAMLDKRRLSYALHSRLSAGDARPPILIGDTLGQMDSYIACADAVFVGASLVRRGGQNLMEPMLQGKPVVLGPHMHNFADLSAQACRAGAAWQGQNAAEVARLIERLLGDKRLRADAAAAGKAIAQRSQGAVERTLDALESALGPLATAL